MPKLVVFTGAGLSAESGIPTFRVGVDALWEGHSVEEVCYISTWKQNRAAVHQFYNARRTASAGAEPNAAHRALAAWQRRWGAELITQNVDDLLERAGAEDVVHLHGRIGHMLCTACGHRWHIGNRDWNWETERCPKCSSIKGVKPDVVFFGEEAPLYARLNKVVEDLGAGDVALVMGTSCDVVHFDLMLERKRCFKAINSLDPIGELGTRVLVFDMVLGMPASQALPKLEAKFTELLGPGNPV